MRFSPPFDALNGFSSSPAHTCAGHSPDSMINTCCTSGVFLQNWVELGQLDTNRCQHSLSHNDTFNQQSVCFAGQRRGGRNNLKPVSWFFKECLTTMYLVTWEKINMSSNLPSLYSTSAVAAVSDVRLPVCVNLLPQGGSDASKCKVCACACTASNVHLFWKWVKKRPEESIGMRLCIYIWLWKISSHNIKLVSQLWLWQLTRLSYYNMYVYNLNRETTNRLGWFIIVIYLIWLKLLNIHCYAMLSYVFIVKSHGKIRLVGRKDVWNPCCKGNSAQPLAFIVST